MEHYRFVADTDKTKAFQAHVGMARVALESGDVSTAEIEAMITGYNTDVSHRDLVLHVQTEDKGIEMATIESRGAGTCRPGTLVLAARWN